MESDIIGNFDVLNVSRPAACIRLVICEKEICVCITAVGDDETVGSVVGAYSKRLSPTNEG